MLVVRLPADADAVVAAGIRTVLVGEVLHASAAVAAWMLADTDDQMSGPAAVAEA